MAGPRLSAPARPRLTGLAPARAGGAGGGGAGGTLSRTSSGSTIRIDLEPPIVGRLTGCAGAGGGVNAGADLDPGRIGLSGPPAVAAAGGDAESVGEWA